VVRAGLEALLDLETVATADGEPVDDVQRVVTAEHVPRLGDPHLDARTAVAPSMARWISCFRRKGSPSEFQPLHRQELTASAARRDATRSACWWVWGSIRTWLPSVHPVVASRSGSTEQCSRCSIRSSWDASAS
jgi:hypothetical protein